MLVFIVYHQLIAKYADTLAGFRYKSQFISLYTYVHISKTQYTNTQCLSSCS